MPNQVLIIYFQVHGKYRSEQKRSEYKRDANRSQKLDQISEIQRTRVRVGPPGKGRESLILKRHFFSGLHLASPRFFINYCLDCQIFCQKIPGLAGSGVKLKLEKMISVRIGDPAVSKKKLKILRKSQPIRTKFHFFFEAADEFIGSNFTPDAANPGHFFRKKYGRYGRYGQ